MPFPAVRGVFLLRLAALAAAVLVCVSASTACAGGPPEPAADDVARLADAYLQAQTDAGFFSGAALIARRGVPVFTKGYGYAEVEGGVPNTPATRFRIASITKTFTAALVMRLHERGALDITRSVCAYVTPCPGAWGDVTLHHLLTHTSGTEEARRSWCGGTRRSERQDPARRSTDHQEGRLGASVCTAASLPEPAVCCERRCKHVL
jgi:CubicO group peptidase (beta-lactamase class C family)